MHVHRAPAKGSVAHRSCHWTRTDPSPVGDDPGPVLGRGPFDLIPVAEVVNVLCVSERSEPEVPLRSGGP